MALPLQRIEGKYEIVAKLREGGMGALYRVRHRLLDEVRVIKVLRPQLEAEEDLRARFSQEARAAIRLRHPNLIHIYDFTLDDEGVGFIVMELIDGVDLRALLADHGPPSLALGLEIARQGLRALGYLHRQGFVHRDLSPDNLMLARDVDGDALVKLIDLGIAKHRESSVELTKSGMFLGKFRYSSPEHFSDREIEPRSDLYAFGLVLYELFTGSHPIVGDDTSSLIAGHLFRPPRDFADSDPDGRLPDDLRSAVLHAIAKKPEERFASAGAFAAALRTIQKRFPCDDQVQAEAAARIARWRDQAEATPNKPGSTQLRLDAGFDLSRTPSPTEAAIPPTVALVEAASAVRAEPRSGSEATGHQPIDKLLAEGCARAARDDFAGAVEAFEQALAVQPDNTTVGQLLAEARESQARQATVQWLSAFDQAMTAVTAALAGGDLAAAETALGRARTLAEEAPSAAARGAADVDDRLAEAADALDAVSRGDDREAEQAIEQTSASIAALIDDDHLVDADRALIQAVETHGKRAEWRDLRRRLDDAHHRARAAQVDALLADAERLAADGDLDAAGDALERARAHAPAGSPSAAAVAALGERLAGQHPPPSRERSVRTSERSIIALLRDHRHQDARRALEQARDELGEAGTFDALRRLLDTVAGEPEPAPAAKAKPRAKPAVTAQAVPAPAAAEPLEPEVASAVAEVEALCHRQAYVRAWRALRAAIDTLGERPALVALRKRLADAMVGGGDG